MPRYHVHRSIQINSTPEKVFAAVADYGTWTTWSPWLCAEPSAQVEVSKNPSSVGSTYSWKGDLVGEGELEHRQLHPNRLIEDEIHFVKPFKSQSQVSFEIEPAGEGTNITWHMHGSLPWFLFWMRSQMAIFIGMDYERGLQMLKECMETGQILSTTKIRGIESVGPLQVVGVRSTCTMDDVGPSMETTFKEAMRLLPEHNLAIDGEMISVYHNTNLKSKTFDYTGGFVVPTSSAPLPDELSSWQLPATRALYVEHNGSYDNLGNAWSAAYQFARYKKLKQTSSGTYEIYKNDPQNTEPADLQTEIFLPLKS
ncbi:MAG: GyrI-like domain-containing protein [Pirellulales bacterium]